MAVKWQQVSSVSIVSLFFVLAGLLNLTGVSFSDDGDKVCTDCFSEIRVNSTFWQIRVEHAGEDKPSVFKKQTRSRTLWVNLDKIEELVTTDPSIKVDILVPTNRIASTLINHPEYGRLRALKDGDTLIFRNTKSRPQPSRIILHGQKGPTQTVKWNFDLEHFLMEDINIDPLWLPTVIPSDTEGKSSFDVEISSGVFEIRECSTREVTRNTYINHTVYFNHTFCSDEPNNKSCSQVPDYEVTEETRFGSETVTERFDCRTIGLKKDGLILDCPENSRCDVIKDYPQFEVTESACNKEVFHDECASTELITLDGEEFTRCTKVNTVSTIIRTTCITETPNGFLNEFCILDCNDGDCNLDAKQSDGRGWSSICILPEDFDSGSSFDVNRFRKSRVTIK